jgi:pimeloyl-ACP methyl ester carboxylesterase
VLLFRNAGGGRSRARVMHDFGGPWGLAWAASNPQGVASITCINTGVLSGYRWHYLARIWQTPVLGELFMASTTKTGMRLLLRHGNPRGLPSQYFDHVYRTFDRGTKRAVLRLYRNTRDTEEGARQLTTAYPPRRLARGLLAQCPSHVRRYRRSGYSRLGSHAGRWSETYQCGQGVLGLNPLAGPSSLSVSRRSPAGRRIRAKLAARRRRRLPTQKAKRREMGSREPRWV